MSIFDGFPLMNAYSVNLDWICKEIKGLREYLEKYTAVNNIRFMGAWDISMQYPRWAIVTNDDSTYIALKPVADGVNITDGDFWEKIPFDATTFSPYLSPEMFGDPSNIKTTIDFVSAISKNGIGYKSPQTTYPDTPVVYESVGLAEGITEFRGSGNGGVNLMFVGTDTSPRTRDDPAFWVRKFTAHSRNPDFNAHSFGSALFEHIAHGSETDIPYMGGYVGVSSIAKAISKNLGTKIAQKWDYRGVNIGLLGEAITDGYNGMVTCGIWSNVASCDIDDETFDNLPADMSAVTIGEEINLWLRHKDVGYKEFLSGNGCSIGLFLNNYQEYPDGNKRQKNWNFAINIDGTPIDGDYTSADIDLWNGHYVGLRIDKIMNSGILFGGYFKSGSYGIKFPDNYGAYKQRPAAAIAIGDNVINIGHYYGATSNDGDIFRSGNLLVYNNRSALCTILNSSKVVANAEAVMPDRLVEIVIGGEKINLLGKYVGGAT